MKRIQPTKRKCPARGGGGGVGAYLPTMVQTMDQIAVKTPNPKCRLHWCLTLIRMTKDKKGLAFFKGLLLSNVLSVKKFKKYLILLLEVILPMNPISGS